ncbi:MAG: hypothetical protein VX015_12405 [Planctomycetota bacterium]|nr:hypothetical protein [Planctomycetota bacterium]
MITINLLPNEYRRKARSPIGVMTAIAAAVLVNTSLFAYYGYLEFGTSANIETSRSVLQLDLDGLKSQVAYHKALQKEIQTRSAREKTLSEITRNRVLWTKTLDELLDVVHEGREGIEHFVWFEDIDVKLEPSGGSSRGGYGRLKAAGHSGSEDYDQVANFLEDIEGRDISGLWQIFGKPQAPQARINDADEDLIPSVNWSFPLTIDLLSPDERVANRSVAEEAGQ